MSDAVRLAHRLGAAVFDYLAQPGGIDGEQMEQWRHLATQFLFDADVMASDAPIVAKAEDIAHAILEWLSPFSGEHSFAKVENTSKEFEHFRISGS